MPRTFLPYMFFILITPKSLHAVSSVSESSSTGNFIFALNASCDLSESHETPKRVVLWIEIQDQLARASAREPEGAAAGAGKAEVRDRLAEHFQRF